MTVILVAAVYGYSNDLERFVLFAEAIMEALKQIKLAA